MSLNTGIKDVIKYRYKGCQPRKKVNEVDIYNLIYIYYTVLLNFLSVILTLDPRTFFVFGTSCLNSS